MWPSAIPGSLTLSILAQCAATKSCRLRQAHIRWRSTGRGTKSIRSCRNRIAPPCLSIRLEQGQSCGALGREWHKAVANRSRASPALDHASSERQAHADEKSRALQPEHAGAIHEIGPFVTDVSEPRRLSV